MENVEPLWSEPSVQYDNFVIFEAKLLSVDIRQKVEREGVEWLNECEIRERPFLRVDMCAPCCFSVMWIVLAKIQGKFVVQICCLGNIPIFLH